jgi:hypothetical protein
MLGGVVAGDIDRYFGLLEEGRAYLFSSFYVVPTLTAMIPSLCANRIILSSKSIVLPSYSSEISSFGFSLVSSSEVLSQTFGSKVLVGLLIVLSCFGLLCVYAF